MSFRISHFARLIAGFLGLLILGGAGLASAQITVEMTLARRTYMFYEPLVATITLNNQAGRDVTFEDTDGKQWFNLEVTTMDGQVLQPYDPNYRLHPLTIQAGQTLRRRIDLSPLFPIREPGSHRVRANVYMAETGKFFTTRYVTFDMAEGQLIWRQDVGVPGSNDTRQVSLLTFQRPDKLMLYARIRDNEGPNVYASQSLGRLVADGTNPQVMFDRQNTLHVLHEAAPSAYLYTEITVNGEWLDQKAYSKKGTNRPSLIKLASGDVELRGGLLQVNEPPSAGSAPVREPKLSDRPKTLPGQERKPPDQ